MAEEPQNQDPYADDPVWKEIESGIVLEHVTELMTRFAVAGLEGSLSDGALKNQNWTPNTVVSQAWEIAIEMVHARPDDYKALLQHRLRMARRQYEYQLRQQGGGIVRAVPANPIIKP